MYWGRCSILRWLRMRNMIENKLTHVSDMDCLALDYSWYWLFYDSVPFSHNNWPTDS